jgi:hypothetical protein
MLSIKNTLLTMKNAMLGIKNPLAKGITYLRVSFVIKYP